MKNSVWAIVAALIFTVTFWASKAEANSLDASEAVVNKFMAKCEKVKAKEDCLQESQAVILSAIADEIIELKHEIAYLKAVAASNSQEIDRIKNVRKF